MRILSTVFSLSIILVASVFLLFVKDLIPYSGSDPYYRQPDFFPRITLIALIVCGIALVGKYATGGKLPVDEELSGSVPHFIILAPLALAFVGYIVLIPWTGYLFSTLMFGCAALLAGRHFNWKSAIAVFLLGVVLELVFVISLDVWFPAAPLSIEGMIR